MTGVLPAGLLRYDLVFQAGGKRQTCRLHFVPPTPEFAIGDVTLFDAFMSRWWTEAVGEVAPPAHYQSAAVTWVQTLAQYLPVAGPPELKLVLRFAKDVVGQDGSPGVPPSSAPVVRLVTLSEFRRAQGRVYFPGLASAYTSGVQQGALSAEGAAGLASAMNALLFLLATEYPAGAGPTWVVWLRSRQVGGPRAMPVVAPIRTCLMARLSLGSQRLRQVGQRPYDLAGAAVEP